MTTPPAAPAPPPLLRRPDEGVFKGVCAAVARTTGTDPVLWRVVVVVLALFGGSGLLLYLAGWLTIPREGEPTSIAERWLRRRDLSRTAVVVLVLCGAVVLATTTGGHVGAGPVVAAALLGVVVLRRQPTLSTGDGAAWLAPRPETDVPSWSAEDRTSTDPSYVRPLWEPAPPLRRPVRSRPRTPVTPVTVGLTLLLTALLLGLHAMGVDGLTVGRVLAADLLLVGAGLLLGAAVGGGRWLFVPAVVLAGALGVTCAAGTPVDLSAGERSWVVTGSGERVLGVGEATLDLGALDSAGTGPTQVTARLGAGHLVVELPRTVRVELHAKLAAGEVLLPDGTQTADGTRLDLVRVFGPPDGPLTRLDVTMGAGQLEVRDAQ